MMPALWILTSVSLTTGILLLLRVVTIIGRVWEMSEADDCPWGEPMAIEAQAEHDPVPAGPYYLSQNSSLAIVENS